MTRLNIKIDGLEQVISGFSEKAKRAAANADKETEKYTRKMANKSAEMAPVESGDMRANIAASPRKIADATWEYGGTLPYTRRQEYEHKSKAGFIRKSVWNNREAYREAVKKAVADD